MTFKVADLCDQYEAQISVAQPIFKDYGGKINFHGKIVTIKCYEDNSLVKDAVNSPGTGHVLVVDGGGSTRRSLLGDNLAQAAFKNNWSGIIIYGCIRDTGIIKTLQIGVKAIGIIPLKTEKKGIGEKNIRVHFADIDFIPGHYVYADEDGVITLPNAAA